MSWSYRVFKKQVPLFNPVLNQDEEYTEYSIRETYDDGGGNINGCSLLPVRVVQGSLDDLKWMLTEMLKACDKPVLED